MTKRVWFTVDPNGQVLCHREKPWYKMYYDFTPCPSGWISGGYDEVGYSKAPTNRHKWQTLCVEVKIGGNHEY